VEIKFKICSYQNKQDAERRLYGMMDRSSFNRKQRVMMMMMMMMVIILINRSEKLIERVYY